MLAECHSEQRMGEKAGCIAGEAQVGANEIVAKQKEKGDKKETKEKLRFVQETVQYSKEGIVDSRIVLYFFEKNQRERNQYSFHVFADS